MPSLWGGPMRSEYAGVIAVKGKISTTAIAVARNSVEKPRIMSFHNDLVSTASFLREGKQITSIAKAILLLGA